jgi:ABC-type transport system involved in multi-copper enzyme maturation permease subunit
MGRELKAYAWRALGFFLILELMLAGAILMFPNFEGKMGTLRAMAPLESLRSMIDQLEEGGIAAYVVGQHFFKGCNTLGSAAAVLFACPAIAGEAQRGTLELWLARPVSRTRLLLERFAFGWLALGVPILASSLSVPWLLARIDESMDVGPLVWCSLHQTLLLGAFYAIAFAWSACGRNPVRIAFVMLFLLTAEFAAYLIMQITHYSVFRLADIDDFMRLVDGAGLDPLICGSLAAVQLAALGFAIWAFRRRLPA